MANQEAFVYCWTDHRDNMLYVGYHKGSQDDGYICSSKWMLNEYNQRSDDFTRMIIAEGTTEDCHMLEKSILKAADAMHSDKFYNMTNGDEKFYNKPGYRLSEESKRNIGAGHIGTKRNETTRSRMSVVRKEMWKNMSFEDKEEFRKMRSEYMKGKPSPRKGVKASEELRKRLSELHTGMKQSKETVEKRVNKNKAKLANDPSYRQRLSDGSKRDWEKRRKKYV